MSHTPPRALLFDSFDTLFSVDGLAPAFEAAGFPHGMVVTWYTRALRDALALTVAGTFKPFAAVSRAAMEVLAADTSSHVTPDGIASILKAFNTLPARDDVRPAFEAARAAGVKVAILTNGSAAVAKSLVDDAKLTSVVDHIVSVDEVSAFKPVAKVYRHAATVVGCAPGEAALVAAHAWDCHGAMTAGLRSAWVRRREKLYNPLMGRPEASGDDLVTVVNALLARR